MKIKTFLFAVLPLALGTVGLSAQTTLSDLAGDWILSNMTLPGEVPTDPLDDRLKIPLQGLPEDAEIGFRPPLLEFEITALNLDEAGIVTETVLESSEGTGEMFSSTVSIDDAGNLVVLEDGDDEEFTIVFNEGKNLLVSSTSEENFIDQNGDVFYEVEFDLITRIPESLSPADLAGDWIFQGAFINDLFNDFEFDPMIDISIGSDGTGTASVPDEGDLPFSFTTGVSGEVNLDFEDGFSLDFRINAAKDVMVKIGIDEIEDVNPDNIPPQWGTIEVERDNTIQVVVRKPETLVAADMAGVWNLFILANDVEWFGTDPFSGDGQSNPDFEPFGRLDGTFAEQVRVVVREPSTEVPDAAPFTATIINPVRDDPETRGEQVRGEIRIVDNKPVLTLNEDGQARQIPFVLNASKDFMISYDAEQPTSDRQILAEDILMAVKKGEADLGIWERTTGAAPRDWLEIPWFGRVFLTDAGSGWVFHEEHGWVFIRGRSLGGFWLFFPGLSTPESPGGVSLWTNQDLYPNFLRVNPDVTEGPLAGFSFVHYAQGFHAQTGELWFYDFATSQWHEETPVLPNQ